MSISNKKYLIEVLFSGVAHLYWAHCLFGIIVASVLSLGSSVEMKSRKIAVKSTRRMTLYRHNRWHFIY